MMAINPTTTAAIITAGQCRHHTQASAATLATASTFSTCPPSNNTATKSAGVKPLACNKAALML
ncbi:MAG: hypothetical protein EBS29_09340 [Chloroflexia bacterium]|nr:hypothetical protein [Chloroflexia bacterium]